VYFENLGGGDEAPYRVFAGPGLLDEVFDNRHALTARQGRKTIGVGTDRPEPIADLLRAWPLLETVFVRGSCWLIRKALVSVRSLGRMESDAASVVPDCGAVERRSGHFVDGRRSPR